MNDVVKVYISNKDGSKKGSPLTSMRTVFDDDGKSLNQYLEEYKEADASAINPYKDAFVVRSQSDFMEWAANPKLGEVSYKHVVIFPGDYELHGRGINLSKTGTRRITGILGGAQNPRITFKNSPIGFYYEQNDDDTKPETNFIARLHDIGFSIKNIEVCMDNTAFDEHNGTCVAFLGVKNIDNVSVNAFNGANTKAYDMIIFQNCAMIRNTSVFFEDRNPDIQPINDYHVIKDCIHYDVVWDGALHNGFGKIKYDTEV